MLRIYRSFIQDIKTLVAIVRRGKKQLKLQKARESMGNDSIPSHVDLENGVLYGLLKQIRHSLRQQESSPQLEAVWCCDILPKQTQLLLVFIKQFLTPCDPIQLLHVKRFNKKTTPGIDGSSKIILQTILCSKEFIETKTELQELFNEQTSDLNSLNFYEAQIPKSLPSTKELAQEWSAKYWPLSWKGNPNHQYLKSTRFNINHEKEMVSQLLKLVKQNNGLPVTLIAKESVLPSFGHEILAIGIDDKKSHTLKHSTMNAIEDIANSDLKLREEKRKEGSEIDKSENNYLCHNLLVYSSHEPCVMCAMALVHSRIGRIVYLKNMENGSLETKYQLGDMDGLNWKFDIWKWIGKEELAELDQIDKCTIKDEI